MAKMSDEERVGRRICRRFGWKARTAAAPRAWSPDPMVVLRFGLAEDIRKSAVWYWGKDRAEAWLDAWRDPDCAFWLEMARDTGVSLPPCLAARRETAASPAEIELAMAAGF